MENTNVFWNLLVNVGGSKPAEVPQPACQPPQSPLISPDPPVSLSTEAPEQGSRGVLGEKRQDLVGDPKGQQAGVGLSFLEWNTEECVVCREGWATRSSLQS